MRDRVLVLRHRARPGQLELHHEHVLQRERRQPERLALRAGPQPAGVQRQDVAERQRPHHGAGDAAQQGQHLLGRAERLHELRERRQLRQRHHLARSQRLRRPAPDALPAGDVDARRSTTSCCSKAASATSSRAGAAAPRRTRTPRAWSRIIEQCARWDCAGQRQHPEPDVPLADDGPVQRRPQQEHHHDVARRRGVRHRRQQPQVRLHRATSSATSARPTAARTTCATASTTACRTSSRSTSTTSRTICGCATTPSTCRSSGRAARLTLQGALRYDRASSWAPGTAAGERASGRAAVVRPRRRS